MRLYALSLAAQRKDDSEQIEIVIHTAMTLITDEGDIDKEALEVARQMFPPSDGWNEHIVHPMEIVQGLPFGEGQFLEWTVRETQEIK